MVTVEVVRSEAAYEDALSVRFHVFVVEQGVDPELEVDEHEDESTHFVAYQNEEPIGAGRLRTYHPEDRTERLAKIERVAVRRDYREQGVGRALMEAIEAHAREEGLRRARLHAQRTSQEFYAALGYEQVGDPFEEAGIPHVAMEKPLVEEA